MLMRRKLLKITPPLVGIELVHGGCNPVAL
jgi:hypothetical protein